MSALAALLCLGATSTTAVAAPSPEGAGEVKVQGDYNLDIFGTTQTDSGVSLREGSVSTSYNIVDRPATSVPSGSSDAWNVDGAEPDVRLRYHIADGKGQLSDFWLAANFSVPLVGGNEKGCAIYKGDPSSGGKKVANSPYSCQWTNTSGYNPHPILKVSSPIEVTDLSQGAALLSKYCNSSTPKACDFSSAKLSSGLANAKVVTVPGGNSFFQNNSPNNNFDTAVTWSQTTSQSTSVGAELSWEVTVPELVKQTAKLTFNRTLVDSFTAAATNTLHVSPRHVGWFERRQAIFTLSGDIYVNSGSQSWVVRNASFTSPDSPNDGQSILVAQDCPLENWTQGTNICTTGLRSHLVR
ncbi:hypothetical protein [Streptomyces vinaceus]|uniref:hypothetical protein n=1 Tax=Streptomyces vinaceus TaxID=1960 RepID=UPI0037FBB469